MVWQCNELVCHHAGILLEPFVTVEPQAPISPLMESVTKRIALEVGPKWIQLYSRLGLGPRDRWRIDSEHADKPMDTKLQNCTRDSIQLWMKTVQHLDEIEAIRDLLIAFNKVPGCAHLAEELSRVNGETILIQIGIIIAEHSEASNLDNCSPVLS